MAAPPLSIRDLGEAGAIVVAPHLVVARGPRGGLTLWRVVGNGLVRRYELALPDEAQLPEGA